MGNGNGSQWNDPKVPWKDRLKLFVYERIFSAKFLVFLVATVMLWVAAWSGKGTLMTLTVWQCVALGYMGVNIAEAIVNKVGSK